MGLVFVPCVEMRRSRFTFPVSHCPSVSSTKKRACSCWWLPAGRLPSRDAQVACGSSSGGTGAAVVMGEPDGSSVGQVPWEGNPPNHWQFLARNYLAWQLIPCFSEGVRSDAA